MGFYSDRYDTLLNMQDSEEENFVQLILSNSYLRSAIKNNQKFLLYKNGRGGQTRTDNPSLPKRVRYQLRYAPTYIMLI